MDTDQINQLLFGFSDFKLIQMDKSDEQTFTVQGNYRPAQVTCPQCKRTHTTAHKPKWLTIRDVPLLGDRPTYLHVKTHQFYCRDCGKYFKVNPPWVRDHATYTKRYGNYIFKQTQQRPNSHVARQEGLNNKMIERIFYREAPHHLHAADKAM